MALLSYWDPEYEELFKSNNSKSKFFLKNISRYKSMFSFTSMGGKVDSSINKGKAPYVFKMSGQNYHAISSLLPKDGTKPKFSQLYIYDTENEIQNRQTIFRCNFIRDTNANTLAAEKMLDTKIIIWLKEMLDRQNVLVQTYRMARDVYKQQPVTDLKLRLICNRQQDGRTYNLPTTSEVAALIVGDIEELYKPRDIVVNKVGGKLEYMNELHPSYVPLQYPLLHPNGEDGYRTQIKHRGVENNDSSKRPYTTMREWFAYMIQDRVGQFSKTLYSRRLFQQLLVDGYTMIESERLCFIRSKQKERRSVTFENLKSLKEQGRSDVTNVGQRIILPSSFTGGARYMMQNYLDAITITCNPKWPEVKRFLQDKNLNADDRPDILCRLFKIKLDSLMKDLKHGDILGKVQAEDILPNVEHVDPYISAEIPDKNEDPELYNLVVELMMHGPCAHYNKPCLCVIDNKCSKNFPKKFQDETSIDIDGFPLYRRRDSGVVVEKSDVNLDNQSVVPYNKKLLKQYQAHINIEWCNQGSSIKYLFKYINKGPDRATVYFSNSGEGEKNTDSNVYEIKEFYDCRYISACEASWRIFGFDVHYRIPAVMRLPFHLPGKQQVIYGTDHDIDNVLEKTDLQLTKDQIKNLTLLKIQKILQQNNSSLTRYETMPFPDEESLSVINNCLVLDEQSYDQQTERIEFENLFTLITSEQKTIFDIITKAVQQNKGGVFFVYGHGGTGKTYLWKTLSSAIRSQGNIVLNVASIGIASLLLSGGRTAHSRFHFSINLNEDSSCVMEQGLDEAELLEKTKLIIWDEAQMTHKHPFQAGQILQRCLKVKFAIWRKGSLLVHECQ
ncbi:uncharacterized protein LOC143563946 [Bidens hawaiensis]|uniref:uncharacterized protein LOC143563946 n=1 Tax=Bidens hawaiensis TaxID=980011 RepID=UPI00404A4FC8